MNTTYPLVNLEPIPLYLDTNADGVPDAPPNRAVITTKRTEEKGFGGQQIVLVIKNPTALGNGAVTLSVQLETTSDAAADWAAFSSPPEYLFTDTLAQGDTRAYQITGPPGQLWRVLNSSGSTLHFEFYVQPNR